MNEKTFLEVLIGGRYAGIAGMQSFESDLNRMKRLFQDTFVRPFQSPAPQIAAGYEAASVAAQKAATASEDVRSAEARLAQSRLQAAGQLAGLSQQEVAAHTSVEQAVLNRAKAEQRMYDAQSKAYANPLSAKANQDYQLAKQEKAIADQRLANAQQMLNVYGLQRKAAEEQQAITDKNLSTALTQKRLAETEARNASAGAYSQAVANEHQIRRQRIAGQLNAVGSIGLMGGVPVLGALGYSAYQAARFQEAIAQIGAKTSMSAQEQAFLMRSIPSLMTRMPVGYNDVLQAYMAMTNAKLGMSEQQKFAATQRVLKLSTSTGANPFDLMFALTGLMNQGGYRGAAAVREVKPLLDMLHQGFALSNMQSVSQFAQVFGPVGATAAVSSNPEMPAQALALLAFLTQHGFSPGRGATQARGLIYQIMNPRAKAQKTLADIYYRSGVNLYGDFSKEGLDKLGIVGVLQDMQRAGVTQSELQQLFPNQRGWQAVQTLLKGNNLSAYQRDVRSVQGAPKMFGGQGPVQYEYQQWLKTAGPQFKQLKTDITSIELSLGQGLLPQVVRLAGAIAPVLKNMQAWSAQHKTLTKLIFDGAAGLTAFSLGLRLMTAAFGPLSIVGKGAAGAIKYFVDSQTVGGYAIRRFAGGIVTAGKAVAQFIPMLIRMGAAWIVGLGPAVWIPAAIIAVGAALVFAYMKIKPFHDAVNGIGSALAGAGRAVLRFGSQLITWIGGAIHGVVGWLQKNGWKLLITAIAFPFLGPIALLFAALPTKWYQYALNAATGFIRGIRDKIQDAGSIAKQFLDTITGWLGFHSPNKYGVDFAVFGGNAGKAWADGLASQKDYSVQQSQNTVQSVAGNLDSDANHKLLYNKGQNLGDQIGKGIQDKLSNTTFTVNAEVNGTNVAMSGKKIVSGPGAGQTVALLPGGYNNPALGPMNTPFGNYANGGRPSANYVSPNDSAFLRAHGVNPSGTVMDTDYPSGPPGSRKRHDVVLPGTAKNKYTLVSEGYDKNTGYYEIWRTPNGGTVTFLHLSSDTINGPHQVAGPHGTNRTVVGPYHPTPGQQVSGGTVVGISGHPITSAYGNDPGFYHLCVVTDAKGRSYVAYATDQQQKMLQRQGYTVKQVGNGTSGDPATAGVNMQSPYVSSWDKKNFGMLQQMAAQYGVPMPILLAMLSNESSGGTDPRAGNNVAQVEPGTYAMLGIKNNGSRHNSVQAGAAYLEYLYNGPAHHNWKLALQMYNGSGRAAQSYADRAYAKAREIGFGDPTASGYSSPSGPGRSSHHASGPDPNAPWGRDKRGLPLPPPPGSSSSDWVKYWSIRHKIDQETFSGTFKGVSWQQLDPAEAKLYEKQQGAVYYDTEQENISQANVWWSKLTPQQRQQKSYQDLYHQMLHGATYAYRKSMSTMQGNFEAQPYLQDAWWKKQDLTNLKEEWSLVTKPWTLSPKMQKEWLVAQKKEHADQAQIWRDQAEAYAKQHKYMKGINDWLKNRLSAIQTWQNTANANSLYKLQHNGQTGATGRAIPVHVIGHCAAEAAANVHRKSAADHAKKGAEHGRKTADNTKHISQRMDELVAEIRKLSSILTGGGKVHTPNPGHPVGKYRDPRYSGQQPAGHAV